MGLPHSNSRTDALLFKHDANIDFVADDMNDLIDTEEGRTLLNRMYRTFMTSQKERLMILEDYSMGDNYTILQGNRRVEDHKSDNRVRHNWGGYISSFITGYMVGKPITITSKSKNEELISFLDKFKFDNDTDNLNYELAYDASRYGRAYELVRRDKENDIIYLVDPKEIFVIRSSSISKEIIGAVHCPVYNDQVYVTIYTDTQIITYEPVASNDLLGFNETERIPHGFGDVPIVEWKNNRFRQGDYESQLSQIDAYDSAQSDTSNYMSDLNDALLVVSGDFNSWDPDGNEGTDDFKRMLDSNLLLLETGIGADGRQTELAAQYLYKQYDVQGTEAYKKRLLDDIYKLSQIPNLDDASFSSNQSGVAMKYKLVTLEQKRTSKQSYFTKALYRRYELIGNIHKEMNDVLVDYNDLEFSFHTNIPENVWEEVESYRTNGGLLSQSTMMNLASFISDPETEFRNIEEELTPEYLADFEKGDVEDEANEESI